MKHNTTSPNKLFLEILPDYISYTEIGSLFSRERLKLLTQTNIRTVFIIASEPVDSQVYLYLTNTFNRAGIQVLSFYYDRPDVQHINTLRSAVNDLNRSLARGGCLVISYRSRFAVPLIACIHIASGKSVDEAIASVQTIGKGASDLGHFRPVLDRFYESLSRPVDDSRIVRDAIKIEKNAPVRPAPMPTLSDSGPVPAAAAPSPQPAAPRVPASEPKVEKKPEAKRAKKQEPVKETVKAEAGTAPPEAPPVALTASKTGPFYRSIRFKLISIISIIIIAALSGVIFLASYFFKNDNMVRVQESNLQISEVIALKIKSEIEKYQLISSVMLKEKKESISGYENLIDTGRREIAFAGIVNKSGPKGGEAFAKTFYNKPLLNKFVISDRDIQTVNDASAKLFQLSFAGEYLINNISPYVNHPVFSLIFPYEHDASGAVSSIMVSYITLDNLMKTFQATGITRVMMVNYKGEVIAHPDENIVKAGADLSTVPICSMMMKSKIDNGQTRFKDDNSVYYLGSFKKIDTGGFGIIATAEEKKAFEAVYDIQRRNILIMAIVLTGAILVIFFFGKTITTPIVRLVWATKKIIEGQYRVDIVPTTKDEIGQLTSTFIEMGKGLEEREKIKSAFGKFVNKDIAEAALRDELRLGGERKTVAILFSDIRAFTSISESLEPEEVVEFLNMYMTKMVACVENADGIVDKFIGDAIMAVWGTPISKGNDTENALNSALMMRHELIHFNKDRGGPRKPYIRIGVGINTGTVLAGQIGSEDRMEYTVIGDPVNLASRIEALNKPFGTDVLISEDSYKLVRDIFAVEKMRQIKVKGKIEPQQIYAVLGRLDDATRPKSLAELQTILGIEHKALSDEAMDQLLDRGEEKYEIIEK
ncbi:MAG: HAMP domain-containing protein [Spirochaetes bacterium]|nr:HAMP domain-containing protein [Spirochaetota bacterium]